MKLNEEQIEAKLSERSGWERTDGKWIVKRFRFRAYLDGIEFVRRTAEEAERLNHHPFIAVDYKLVTLRLTTWRAGGLTALDFEAADAFDRAYAASRADGDGPA